MVTVSIIISCLSLIASGPAFYTGVYSGTVRTASGPAGLGLRDEVRTTFAVEERNDSLIVSAISRAGRSEVLGAWSRKHVKVLTNGFTARGRNTGATIHRRDMTFECTGKVRGSGELTLRGKGADDGSYFGGSRVLVTGIKVR